MSHLKVVENLHSGEMTMTSLEVAELTKVRHPDVLRKIRELAGKGIIRDFKQIAQKYESTKKAGRPPKVCRLNKTESINLVANLCPEFTARIIERWLELERQVSGQSPYEQLQALTMNMKLSRQLGQIGSTLMNKRREDKRLLQDIEKRLAIQCQISIDFGFGY